MDGDKNDAQQLGRGRRLRRATHFGSQFTNGDDVAMHVGSQARAGAEADAEAGAGAARVTILCGGHATKSK